MPSSRILNTLIRSATRIASQNGPKHMTWRPPRLYSTEGPPMSHGGKNRPLIIAGLLGVPAIAYFMIPPRPGQGVSAGAGAGTAKKTTADNVKRPGLDPAARSRERKEVDDIGVPAKYAHPEHLDPEEFKPAFGLKHKQKRVDYPPDERHHQAMNDRARK
ncbi:hypothetical protein GGR50DRAFT_678803 [Xylaria sp. CBS 124048]|nr:hypothetical protein GGR50DRAFT_678803 [Xylaria sp. CBS 124048]